ncbi:BnaA05g17870D [Brassica napus]|uniref:(rape) hypothetical protein n=1 Tax=Brassica napus TaxID=3708 RepID=A0A078GK43_BRANA|nr:unnamed protein product [Brassica napus]CDY26925.1 BnaA05g17870D [Brassica napus]
MDLWEEKKNKREKMKEYFDIVHNDGLHFRQPWVFDVQEEVQRLKKRMNKMADEIAELKSLCPMVHEFRYCTRTQKYQALTSHFHILVYDSDAFWFFRLELRSELLLGKNAQVYLRTK